MKVLFKEFVVNVGHPGDIKEVSTGYAKNFLIPQWKAIELTPQAEKEYREKLKKEDKHNRELIENRHKIAEQLNWQILNFKLKSDKNWKVFGWIGEKDVIKTINSKFKIKLAKKHINLPDGHIKKIWESQIFIKLWKDSMAKITAKVEAE